LPADRWPIKVFNLGCGPALEIQDFLANSELSNHAQFTLLDFNDETIEHVSAVLQSAKRVHRRRTSIQCVKKSVAQLLKEAAKAGAGPSGAGYDVVYCAGLFDYLTAPVCTRLMSLFYEMLAPGGLLVATNVFAINPSRNWMEYSVDWHLIYRDRAGMTGICPPQAPADACVVKSDPTGLNLFVEVRKPVP
jgi:extracellular factor (EF) 3-hydroxypalmitic acid methyl ester biosynthesis protein